MKAFLWYSSLLLLVLGLAAQVMALLNMRNMDGELYNDVGISLWVLAAVLLLVRLNLGPKLAG